MLMPIRSRRVIQIHLNNMAGFTFRSKVLPAIVVVSAFVGSLAIVSAQAEDLGAPEPEAEAVAKLQFPIAQLGNCADKTACRAYCEAPDNRAACMDFAEKNNLIKKEKIEQHKKLREISEQGGPGGCTGEKECHAFCSQEKNLEICVRFAKERKLMPQEEIDRAEKMIKILKEGGSTPGNCKGAACKQYCEDTAHAEECIAFAEKAGFMKAEEAVQAKKMIGFIKNRETPGGCSSKEQCETYCQQESHMDECLRFAERAGVIKPEEVQKIRSMPRTGPGGCTSQETCEAFCSQEANREICMKFAQENQLMTQEQVMQRRQQMRPQQMPPPLQQGGPCLSEDPNDREACLNGRTQVKEFYPTLELDEAGEGRPSVPPPEWFKDNAGQQGRPLTPAMMKEKCLAAGGAWDGQVCSGVSSEPGQFRKPVQDAGQLDEAQKKCLNYGGNWNNGRCVMNSPAPGIKPMPAPSDEMMKRCYEKGGAWSEGRCIVTTPSANGALEQFNKPMMYPPEKPLAPSGGGAGSGFAPAPGFISPEQICAEHGGTWNGQDCDLEKEPPLPPIDPALLLQSSVFEIFKPLLGIQ